MNKILLVDDDRYACEALAAALRILGYSTAVVCNGAEAEKRAAEFDPDVVIVDLMLPGISGMDIVTRLAAPPKRLYCSLATGIADFALLKRALAAGGWTLLSKPFHLAHLAAILHNAATMISARNLLPTLRDEPQLKSFTITRRGDTPVNSEDIGRVMQFARQSGADEDTALRRLPIVVYELLTNARTYGATESSEQWYSLQLESDPSEIHVRVSDSGRGFAWKKELSRARTSWEKSKAGGLQIVSALCGEILFGGDNFTASVSLAKVSEYEKASATSETTRVK